MPIDLAVALGADLGESTFSWTASDVALYNLAVGAAADPLDTAGLRYVDDHSPIVLPTFATVAEGFHDTDPPAVSFPGVEIDLAKVVHGSQHVIAHAPIPPSGTATTRTRIADVQDKGSAAVIVKESETTGSDGTRLWTSRTAIFAKGEGGFGGDRGTSTRVDYPDTPPDHVVTVPTRPDQALLYRLCGDRNPLHSDPAFAQRAGFPAPILHGLCSFGLTCRAVVDAVFGGDPTAVGSFGATFAGVVFPGETLRISLWDHGSDLVATAVAVERDASPVLANVVVEKA